MNCDDIVWAHILCLLQCDCYGRQLYILKDFYLERLG